MKLLRSALAYLMVPRRGMRNEHWDIRFRRIRSLQPWARPLDLAKWQGMEDGDAPSVRAELKKAGFMPPPVYRDRPINLSTSGVVFDAYVPPESDGIASLLSRERAKQVAELFSKKSKSYMHVRKIRQYDPDFDPKTFGQKALDIYVDAHTLLQYPAENEQQLHELCTEKAFAEMVDALRRHRQTLRWRFIESIEAARVVHVRAEPLIDNENLFAQVTVRLATRQALAIYDRFGRPMYGDEQLVRDVLDYVVFEKHVADEYGEWRLHGKLMPAHNVANSPLINLRTLKRPPQPAVQDLEVAESSSPSGSNQAAAAASSGTEELTDEQLAEEESKLRDLAATRKRNQSAESQSETQSRS